MPDKPDTQPAHTLTATARLNNYGWVFSYSKSMADVVASLSRPTDRPGNVMKVEITVRRVE